MTRLQWLLLTSGFVPIFVGLFHLKNRSFGFAFLLVTLGVGWSVVMFSIRMEMSVRELLGQPVTSIIVGNPEEERDDSASALHAPEGSRDVDERDDDNAELVSEAEGLKITAKLCREECTARSYTDVDCTRFCGCAQVQLLERYEFATVDQFKALNDVAMEKCAKKHKLDKANP